MTQPGEPLAFLEAVVSEGMTGDGCRLWPFALTRGYPQMALDGRNRRVGQVVLERTGRPRPPGLEVCHSCDDARCIAPWHVRWDTHEANMAELVERGRLPRGGDRPNAAFDDETIREIRTRAASGETNRSIAADLGVTPQTLGKIVLRQTYRHVV